MACQDPQKLTAKAPWPDLRQVEQDLIICRALCDLFNAAELKGKIAFRGGAALHKLLFAQPLRYSEDIDFVETNSEPTGATVDAISRTWSWLGSGKREQAGHSIHLIFCYTFEADAGTQLKFKVEIKSREHVCLLRLKNYPFAVQSLSHLRELDLLRGQLEAATSLSQSCFPDKLP